MRFPVTFVVPYDDALTERLQHADPDNMVRNDDPFGQYISGGGAACWCFLTYARLRDRGFAAKLANKADPQTINVAHADSLNCATDYADVFYVDVRADHSHRLFAQFTLVQNRDQLAPDTVWIPLWSQPGLIGRAEPVSEIRQIGYVGQTGNNNLAMTADDWNRLVGGNGYVFRAPEMNRWHDLSGFDALIAIRSFDDSPHSKKPPSKLLNAWRAGLPLIGGKDSAYAQVGTPGEDYLVATDPKGVLNALNLLRREPGFRQQLIERGKVRAEQYSDDALSQMWIDALEGPIADRFARWQAQPARERMRAQAMKLADSALVESKALVRRLTGLGPRTN